MVALGLGCFARASSIYSEPGLLLAAMCGPLMVAASLAEKHGLWAERLQQLRLVGSGGVVAIIDFCFTARGIFPDQELNLCLLDWQAGSLPQCHQRSPTHFIFF